MSKNIRATFWASVAFASLVLGIWVIKIQTPSNSVAGTVAVINKAFSKVTANISNSAEPAPVPTATTTPTSTPPTLKRRTAPKVPMLSYGEAVNYYANTRIQFDPSCHGIPSRMAVANPVTLMLDNRSAGPQKIVIAGKTYNVAAYNYVIVTIKEKTLPVHLMVNCNSSVNVTEIIVE